MVHRIVLEGENEAGKGFRGCLAGVTVVCAGIREGHAEPSAKERETPLNREKTVPGHGSSTYREGA